MSSTVISPRHLVLISAAFILSSVLLTGCCCPVGGSSDATPRDVCRKMERLASAEGLSLSPDDIDKCVGEMRKLKEKDEDAFECAAECSDDALGFEELGNCMSACEKGGGKGSDPIKVSAKAKVSKDSPGRVTIEIKTKAKSKIEVKVQQGLSGSPQTKKATADKKGKAKVTFKKLAKGNYTARVEAFGDGFGSSSVDFEIEGFKYTLEARKPPGTQTGISNCTLALATPSGEKLSATVGLGYAGASGDPLNAKLRVKVKGGKYIKIGGKKTEFKKDRADVALDLGKVFAKTPALQMSAASPTSGLSAKLKAGSNTYEGELRCAANSIRAKLFPNYKGQPIRLPGDGDGPSSKKNIMVVQGNLIKKIIGNTNSKLGDIDYIAKVEFQTRKLRGCAYINNTTGAKIILPREASHKKATIYDRRSGRRLQNKLVKAPTPQCPATIRTDNQSGIREFASDAAVYTAIQQMRARLK